MTSKFTHSLLLTIALVTTLANVNVPGAALTDVVVFGADGSGAHGGLPDAWETRPGGNFNVWIQSGASGGPFLTGPSDAAAQPNISLSLGVNTFRLLGAPGADVSNFGINLFFNGSSTPSISAFGPMLTSTAQSHVFSADSSASTPQTIPSNGSVPGAGQLSFVSGNQLITLTDFYWATPSVYGLDLVGQNTTGPDGQLDYVGGITFNVTTIPEPQSPMLLLVGALVCFGAMKWFGNKRQMRKN